MKPSSPADSKNIEIIDVETDAEPRVLRPTDALQFIVERIGLEKVLNGSVRHLGAKLLVHHPFKINLNTYKKLDDDLYLNRKGTATDKFRTITILNSVHRLNLSIRLTTEPPTKVRKPQASAKPTRAPRKKLAFETVSNQEATFMAEIAEPDFAFGADGVLNLFDD